MDLRNHEAGAAGTAPAVPANPSHGFPTEGSPQNGIPATKPGAYWFHQISEELRNLILAAGITPDSDDLGQLSEAISELTSVDEGGIPEGTRMLFIQSVAPIGWTRDYSDAANNRMLRVVNVAGGGVGGSSSPIAAHMHSTSSHTLTLSQIPSHSHTTYVSYDRGPGTLGNAVYGDENHYGTAALNSNSKGGGASHNHGNSGLAFVPRYLDSLIAEKN